MSYASLREFLSHLQALGELTRVAPAVDPKLEVTEICARVLRAGGPALLFENPKGARVPLLANLFGTTARVARAMGCASLAEVRALGRALAFLREPRLPQGIGEALERLPDLARLLQLPPRLLNRGACQEEIVEGSALDLLRLPIQTCWPEDAGPLITFGLVITKGPYKQRQNVAVYRQQVIAPNKLIMRWLAHRGGAIDYQEWCEVYPGTPFPVAVVIGADPATLVAAVTPLPDALSEYQFAGLLRDGRTELVRCTSSALQVPASAEIVLEGCIVPGDEALEGPFGDHTGYYNAQARFPVLTVQRLTHRRDPIYHSTYMGRSPYDEPSTLAIVLNELFIPILQRQFPEIVDFYLPPEACSYRLALVSIRKRYPGHARRVMLGVWSYLRQFTYTKFVIVTDDDINIRDWKDVLWALSTRVDPARDSMMIEHTPIDYLDFASPVPGLGSKIGFDATNKLPGETSRAWGRPITTSEEIKRRVDALWGELGLADAPPAAGAAAARP